MKPYRNGSPRHAVAFRVDSATMAALERAAADEGLSFADVARRALLADLRRRQGVERLAGKPETA